MAQRIKLTINGNPYDVEIDDLNASPLTVWVNGTEYQVTVDDTDAAAGPAVKAGAAKKDAPAVSASPRPSRASAPAAATLSSDDTLAAPMPGVILDIAVKPGDTVLRGELLCSLEAMKMKNAIRAPRDVTIAAVEVQESQRVNYGDVLFKFTG